jgi:hypothetical protein
MVDRVVEMRDDLMDAYEVDWSEYHSGELLAVNLDLMTAVHWGLYAAEQMAQQKVFVKAAELVAA